MAAKGTSAKKAAKSKEGESVPQTEPKFPYTTKPGSLRKLLKEIPKRPKPQKFDINLLKAWGFRDSNDYTMVRVLKAVGFLSDGNVPTDRYAEFMHPEDAGKALGTEVRRVYAPLFQASHTPHIDSAENLRTLFNIHSGGGNSTMDHQINTFKALAENANLTASPLDAKINSNPPGPQLNATGTPLGGDQSYPTVNINLHIHLPENKSRRDYEDIIEDIGRYIFGRAGSNSRE